MMSAVFVLCCFTACGNVGKAGTVADGELQINDIFASGIRLMSQAESMSANTVRISATIEPENAEVDLIWKLSGIATPTDYIEMQVSEDSKSATLSVKKPFGEEITLTVSSAANPDANASCILKYRKKVERIDKAFVFGTSANSEDISVKGNVIEKSFVVDLKNSDAAEKLYVNFHPELIEYGIGTFGGADVYSLYLAISWDTTFLSSLESVGLSQADVLNDFSGSFGGKFTGNLVLSFESSKFFKESFGDFTKVREALKKSNGYFLKCSFKISGVSNNQIIAPVTYTIKVDPNSIYIKADEVTLDKEEVIF